MKLIFVVFYVWRTTGLTRCYKTEVFYIYICSYSTIFHAISISYTTPVQEAGKLFPNQISIKYLTQSTAEIKLIPV